MQGESLPNYLIGAVFASRDAAEAYKAEMPTPEAYTVEAWEVK